MALTVVSSWGREQRKNCQIWLYVRKTQNGEHWAQQQ